MAPRGAKPMDRSQELLDAVKRLAEATENLGETLPVLIEGLESVSQMYAVLIALEAQKRNVSPEKLIQGTLSSLMDRVVGSMTGNDQ